MQIFQNHEQRRLRRDTFERLTDFPYHALSRAPQNLSLEELSLFGLDQFGKLNQPRRRSLGDRLDQETVFRTLK